MSQSYTIGVDRKGDHFYTAQVARDTGRPEVRSLVRFNCRQIHENNDLDGANVVLSVPDHQVLAKRLRLDDIDAPDFRDRCTFELAQAMFEPEDAFRFDLLAIADSHYQLGLIYRREQLDNMLSEYSPGAEPTQVGYLVRAAALGRGYLSFCRQVPGELIALADFTDNLASICLIRHRQVVELAFLTLEEGDLSSDADIKRTTIEFKTVVNFKLSSCADRGISLPLAALVLNGDRIDSRVRNVFAEYFPVGVSAPEIHRGFFHEQVDVNEIPLGSYLVALGLTVN